MDSRNPQLPPRDEFEEERDAGGDALIEEMRRWSKPEAAGPPLDFAALDAAIARRSAPVRVAPRWSPPAGAWTMAAAAMLVFALTRASFTVRLGDSEWSWGKEPAPQVAAALPAASPDLTPVVKEMAALMAEHEAWLAELEETNEWISAQGEQTRAELTNLQRIESTTRYEDVERLINLVQRQALHFDDKIDYLTASGGQPQ